MGADDFGEVWNCDAVRNGEPCAEIVPEGDADFAQVLLSERKASRQLRRAKDATVSHEKESERSALSQDILLADGGFAIDLTAMDLVFFAPR